MDKKLTVLKNHLSRNLRARRAYLGLSQEELALKSGVARKYLSMMEGGTANPTIQILQQLAGVLETSVSELLADKANA